MVFRAHLIVSGSVQGVNFRWFVQQTAKELGLNGWVKNLPDGTVEIECESETEKTYREFLSKIEKGGEEKGLSAISVENVKVVDFERDAASKHNYFNIEY
ncbi:acylphosphatase [Candidatus Micrarchaeota archaeon]|nr:acylphosphatase [Candidatus Micrarchaeota archaeon]MBD3417882.1 acylphosphatase [Candidatus Micrarchaeota archaeon]